MMLNLWVEQDYHNGLTLHTEQTDDRYPVQVSEADFERYQEIERVYREAESDYQEAQTELERLYDQAAAVAEAAEEAKYAEEERQREQEYEAEVAAHAVREAELDQQDGPREFTYRKRYGISGNLLSTTIHRDSCRYAQSGSSYSNGTTVRLPKAIEWLSDLSLRGHASGEFAKPCKQCCPDLLPETDEPTVLRTTVNRNDEVLNKETKEILGRVGRMAVMGGWRWYAYDFRGVLVDQEFFTRGDAVAHIVKAWEMRDDIETRDGA